MKTGSTLNWELAMTNDVKKFTQALLALDRLGASQLLENRTSGDKPIRFIEDVVIRALEIIGEEWLKGNVALSQVYMAGKICEELVDTVLPPAAPERKDQPKMAICVLHDHHSLGKNIVYSLLRASGFELLDFGTVDEETLVQRVEKEQVKVLLISVLMLPSALKIANLREKLSKKNDNVKIVVGGAPFRYDGQLWREVGADAVCASASDAPSLINKLIQGK